MQSNDISELHYLLSSYPNTSPPYGNFSQNNAPEHNPLYNLPINPYNQEFNPQQMSFSNNSTSDEAEEHQFSTIINERKKRRMISNRESARRSRMRKQRHLDELFSQVVWLRNENRNILDKWNNFLESHDTVVQENVRLKEEISGLRQVITDMQLGSPFPSFDLGNESSNQSDTSP